MSRFGLRSATDILKQSEEKPNRRKTCNPISISMKRSMQQKDTKYSPSAHEDKGIDDIKIELEDVERISDSVDGMSKNKNINGDDDEDEEDADDCTRQLASFKGNLICSLPLERISDVIQRLNLSKTTEDGFESIIATQQQCLVEKEAGEIDESLENDDDDEDENNISKQSTMAIKNLCLYCDKKFSSNKLQLKHVENFHCLQQDRRCSGRNSQLQQPHVPRKRKSPIGANNFPGCTFCQKSKSLSLSVILPSSDLNALFVHLADCHTDKYFGCKSCVLRFQNVTKLSKHMEDVHKSLPFALDETSSKSRDNDTDSMLSSEKASTRERSKLSSKRPQRLQRTSSVGSANSVGSYNPSTAPLQCPVAIRANTSVIGAEEPILSRLGLTQNRLPNNRKGLRLRREKILPEMLLKSEQSNPSTGFVSNLPIATSLPTTCSPKMRGKTIKTSSSVTGDALPEAVFRVPMRSDVLSCVFDDNFYKEVITNVRQNLLFHLDGKIMGNASQSLDDLLIAQHPPPQIRSTLVKSPIVVTTADSEIHAATSLDAITAFPTLLTASQFGVDGVSAKLRRPHTKNSWKWKWDSVKKFKLVNEGGKIVKKMKQPMQGLRDLSKLDMWTQLTMRQKHEMAQQEDKCDYREGLSWSLALAERSIDPSRQEKLLLNDQLNMILDRRLLPNIVLEQNEQAIIKIENEEQESPGESEPIDQLAMQPFLEDSFLSMLNLPPTRKVQKPRTKVVLSGEWARPRCYMCMCCGAKFEKLKSLEEHKMFRHSQILSTHYEVVGRELLNGNLLRHLFLPKKALSRYTNELGSHMLYSGAVRRLFWHKNETLVRDMVNNDESSDSLQSMLNSCATNSPSAKNSSSTEDCETEAKISTTTALGLVASSAVVSPTHSIQSCSSTSSAGRKQQSQPKLQSHLQASPNIISSPSGHPHSCSKCGRKCNGTHDLYRHMLDCSGDYVWSLAKKRKYRYYCGSKKRRPCNKHSLLELRKNKPKAAHKPNSCSNESGPDVVASTSGNMPKVKTSPRPRPSDAESIKKMLENLPPKRVCKTIFPALSKAKKTLKNIKPKMLVKHKMYHSLRKTRVRQMTQAAKILSKTKSQLNKPKKMTTRSSAAPSPANLVARKATTKQQRLRNFLNKSKKPDNVSKSQALSNSTDVNVEYKDEVMKSIKVEEEQEKELLPIEDNKTLQTEASASLCPVIEANVEDNLSMQQQHKYDRLCKGNKTLPESNVKPAKVVPQQQSGAENSPQTNHKSQENTHRVNRKASNPTQITNEAQRDMASNKTVKRSKRISDCIAMLTGKLEQKLKTELKVPGPAKTAAEVSVEMPVPKTPPQVSEPEQQEMLVVPVPAAKPIAQQPLPSKIGVTVEASPDKNLPSKKTPKRKTISRRILKTDNEEKSIGLDVPDCIAKTATPIPKVGAAPPLAEVTKIDDKPTHASTPSLSSVTPPVSIPNKSAKVNEPLVAAKVEQNQIKLIPAAMLSSIPPVIALNNAGLISKVPLYLPAENLRSPQLAPLPVPLPLPVPVQMPVPVPLPVPVQVPPMALANLAQPQQPAQHTVTVTAGGMNLIPSAAIPLITAAPPAHITPQPSITMPVPSFSIPVSAEPLNLSSSSKNAYRQSQDLSCSGRQRVGAIPARRKTICGFEARNFVMYDEMEPLDLSKKTQDIHASAAPIVSKAIELNPLVSAQSPLPPVLQPTSMESVDSAPLPMLSIASETLLSKPYYSNLDLLKIPQFRNPTIGPVPAPLPVPMTIGMPVSVPATVPVPVPVPVPAPAPPSMSVPVAIEQTNSISQPMLSVNTAVVAPPPSAVTPVKQSAKKRSKASVVGATNSDNTISSTNNSPLKANNAKDTSNSKKEALAKGKVVLRMDEEVINHIDDAINSVINAVKASLDSEEAEKSRQMGLLSQTLLPKTTDDVHTPKQSVGEFRYLAAGRRNMRSKTLDCRPAALAKCAIAESPPPAQVITAPTAAIPTPAAITGPLISVRNVETLKEKSSTVKSPTVTDFTSKNICIASGNPLPGYQRSNKLQVDCTVAAADSMSQSRGQPLTLSAADTYSISVHSNTTEPFPVVNPIRPSDSINRSSPEKTVEKPNTLPLVPAVEADSSVNNAVPTSQTHLDVEQMSNNNNTSSGFHSSAQSDPQTSVMSTATSVSASAAVSDTKKKQRRRRKNELAAIVADQLLESFKLDKARRDNLKKLENLAYEKSEDLLLTGMLLMSSTKRNVNSATGTQDPPALVATAQEKRQDSLEIAKQPVCDTKAAEEKVDAKVLVDNDAASAACNDNGDIKKGNRRRQGNRRRGKTIDNENISKLKSSLESFSIDIERQLTEYEAKSVNVFQNVAANDVEKGLGGAKSQAKAVSKPTVILRPSILSMTLEASANVDNSQTVRLPPAAISDATKTMVSSRDPRLNKNIHKKGDKDNDTTTAEDKTIGPAKKRAEVVAEGEDDPYMTELTKNMHDKHMNADNDEYLFKDDGYDMTNGIGIDDLHGKYMRPATSMSVRSAPNFNDDRSNFGSMCDENTNTEVMDMDLDDEMTVYTSYSQDLGRGRGRRRRRRRSILLTRKPKKKSSRRDQSEKIECILCKKVFYSANSLTKHNMTLAHVSKVSEQEYLMSKSHNTSMMIIETNKSTGTLGPYARRSARRATISEPPMQMRSCIDNSLSPRPTAIASVVAVAAPEQPPSLQVATKLPVVNQVVQATAKKQEATQQQEVVVEPKITAAQQTTKDNPPNIEFDGNHGSTANPAFNGNSRLNLNPDERLFFECCNILKSAETPRINNAVVAEECNNVTTNYPEYPFGRQEAKVDNSSARVALPSVNADSTTMRHNPAPIARHGPSSVPTTHNHPPTSCAIEQQSMFRDPQLVTTSNCYSKNIPANRSPTYSAISHLSAVTNTTSRFKTKAAMKGYENVNMDLLHLQESKSRTICKLTELAEIALGNEDKPNSHSFSPIQTSSTPPRTMAHQTPCPQQVDVVDSAMRNKGTPDFGTLLAADNPKETHIKMSGRSERTKNNETRSSTSSKTIMHSSIIKAAVEEHQKPPNPGKIIIPERPFKNIGLEEKAPITFQKPKTPAVNLLAEDNNSVSTGSFSDRDDYDFGSLSCEEEAASVRESNDKNLKNNSSDSSSESSRATAKTFENKSLIMGRIFKNVSTKAAAKNNVAAIKVKSVGVQKDQTPTPKADLNQLFDELRGNACVEAAASERSAHAGGNERASSQFAGSRLNFKQQQQQQHQYQRDVSKHVPAPRHIAPISSPPAIVSSTTATPTTSARKSKSRESRAKPKTASKTRKHIAKMKSDTGMSSDEDKKLMRDGQRKSKRRCTTNRPKKLVEMWSSDEYEEFQYTKDIMALIEEKEQEEKRRKRKTSVNISSNTSEVGKEKDTSDVTSSTKEPKRKSAKKVANEQPLPEVVQEKKSSKSKKAQVKTKEDVVSTTAALLEEKKPIFIPKETAKAVPSENSSSAKTKSASKPSNTKTKTPPKPKVSKAKTPNNRTRTTKPLSVQDAEEDEDNDNELDANAYDDDEDYVVTNLRQNTRSKKAATTRSKQASASATVTSTVEVKTPKPVPAAAPSNKRNRATANTGAGAPAAETSVNVVTNANTNESNNNNIKSAKITPPKAKRKSQANQSPARRKRQATDKLYYWSSSSDEDFGRVKGSKINAAAAGFETGGEQYQKHGWIVGDSHKKLVTLLAIAKGNKKLDSNSGVKRNGNKKRT